MIRAALLLLLPAALVAQHDHHASSTAEPLVGSGTAWLPAATPVRGVHATAGDWRLMLHGSVFVQYVREFGTRGNYQLGSVNWIMGEAARSLAGGTLGVRVMASAEVLTVTERGYPQLLQVAQPYQGGTLTDRMHPHELVGEAAVTYEHRLAGDLRASVYIAAVGEPALGPVAYLHRPSTANNPAAPLGHHTQDVTHESFGVGTIGVLTNRIRLEASLFNGAHPDEVRTDFDYDGARLDAVAVRLTVNPAASWSIAASGAYLPATSGPHAHAALRRFNVSILHVAPRPDGRAWSTTAVIGANIPTDTRRALPALLLESNLELDRDHTLFGRAEYASRTAEDLDLVGSVPSDVRLGAISVGYARRLAAVAGLTARIGVRGGVAVLPEELRVFYGSRMPPGVTAYLQLRP